MIRTEEGGRKKGSEVKRVLPRPAAGIPLLGMHRTYHHAVQKAADGIVRHRGQ